MNKLFVASLFLGLASISQAAFIQCAPPQDKVLDSGNLTSKDFTCSPGGSGASANVNADGLSIVELRIRVNGTFQDSSATEGLTYSLVFNGTNNGSTLPTGSFTLGPVACTASDVADEFGLTIGGCAQTSAFVSVAGLPDSVPTFTVTVSGAANGIDPLPFNATAAVSYEVNTIPSVPEPSTYAMMAAGLLGLVAARRRS